MIDICFSRSDAGVLGAILHTKEEIGEIATAAENMFPSPEMQEILTAPSDERIEISLWLNLGEIAAEQFAKNRIEVLRAFYDRKSKARRRYIAYTKAVQSIVAAAENHVPLRIWYSDAEYAMCGLYYICSQLENTDGDITLIPFPPENKCKTWAMCLGEPMDYLYLAHKATKEEIALYAREWERLRRENGLLRVNENGVLKSAGEDYFDAFILENLTDTPMQMVSLLGQVLGKTFDRNQYVLDGFLCDRILDLIDRGKIKIVGEYEPDSRMDTYPHYLLQKA
ncbi:MAG: DUF3658 domain-containing protein [Candidatus Fimenecus sp.]